VEFLVHFKLVGLDRLPEARALALRAQEAKAGGRHRTEGRIQRVWRVPGRQDAISLWRVKDADELHEHLSSLPLFKYMDITVTPLALHYLEAK
jgi:muconolactone D-isomerase